MHSHERLALALDWTMDRLHTALDELDTRLRPIGLRIHSHTMGVTIRPADQRGEPAARKLEQVRDAEEGLHRGMARVLYAVHEGTLSQTETKADHRLHLGALQHRGAVTTSGDTRGRFAISPYTAYAFNVTPD